MPTKLVTKEGQTQLTYEDRMYFRDKFDACYIITDAAVTIIFGGQITQYEAESPKLVERQTYQDWCIKLQQQRSNYSPAGAKEINQRYVDVINRMHKNI